LWNLGQSSPHEINSINGTSIAGIGRGKIIVKIGKGRKLNLVDVLYVPQASLRLISVGRLADGGVSSLFNKMRCSLICGSKNIAPRTRTGISLYSLNESHYCIIKRANIACMAPDLETWHKRLGHVNYVSIIEMADNWLATGMPTDLSTLPAICKSCVLSKQTKTLIPKVWEGGRVERIFEKVFSDITGLEGMRTPAGELYALNFVDDCSDKMWVYPLKNKSDTTTKFKEWKTIVEKETGLKVKTYCTDNGGEFTSNNL